MPIINMVYKKKKWWKPWANTVLYLPFENDLLDYSPNHYTMTQTWTITKATIWYYFSQPSSWESKIASSYTTAQAVWSYPFTANVWCKKDTTSWSQHGWIWWNSVYNSSWTNTIYNSSQVRIEWDAPWAISSSWYSIDNADEWTNFWIVEKADQILFYQNWVLKATRNQSRPLSNLSLWLLLYADGTWVWQTYSRFIVEKWEWSADDFLNYYNQTKENYEDKIDNYQKVEYIESSGSWCILNTWIQPKDSPYFRIEFKMYPTSLKSSWNYFYGAENSPRCSFEHWNGDCYWNAWNTTWLWQHSMSAQNLYTYDITYNNGSLVVVSNNYNNTLSYSWTLWVWPLTFFCQWTSWNSQSADRLYYLKLYQWDGLPLVRDFVPCYRKADGVIWMFDLVNKKFYTNSWSWTFTKWPDVN